MRGRGQGKRLDYPKTAREQEITELRARPAVSTHRNYPAVIHCVCVCVCVCVSKSVIVLHPNGAGWRKVPVLGASGCCSCLLVARLPGIDKAAPGPCQHTHFLTSMVSPVLKVFPGKTKPHVVLLCGRRRWQTLTFDKKPTKTHLTLK